MSKPRPGEQIRLAVAQIEPRLGDIDANVDIHLEAIAEARAARCDLVLFPELSLTGYSIDEHGYALARERNSAEITRLAKAADGITAVIGFMEEGPAAQFHNSAIAVRDGGIVHLHRKVNLPSYGKLEEAKHFAAGRFVETAPLSAAWRYATLICADAWNPGLVHLAAMHGATLLLFPTASALEGVGGGFNNPRGWGLAIRFYAMIYGLPLVMANRVGQERDLRYWGGSTIVDAYGTVLARAGDTPDLIIADVDYADVRAARYQLPTVRDSNFSLIEREIGRLGEILGVPASVRGE
jgi:predicted amidohydrolase